MTEELLFSNDDYITELGCPLTGTVEEMSAYIQEMGFPLTTQWELFRSDGGKVSIWATQNGWIRIVLTDPQGKEVESPVLPVKFLEGLVN